MTNLSLFPIERNRYFYGKLLTVRDFELEQKYLNDKRRLLNLAIAGPGVVCGLTVSKSDDMTLMLESGLALDCMGREIVVDAPVIKKLQMHAIASSTVEMSDIIFIPSYLSFIFRMYSGPVSPFSRKRKVPSTAMSGVSIAMSASTSLNEPVIRTKPSAK